LKSLDEGIKRQEQIKVNSAHQIIKHLGKFNVKQFNYTSLNGEIVSRESLQRLEHVAINDNMIANLYILSEMVWGFDAIGYKVSD